MRASSPYRAGLGYIGSSSSSSSALTPRMPSRDRGASATPTSLPHRERSSSPARRTGSATSPYRASAFSSSYVPVTLSHHAGLPGTVSRPSSARVASPVRSLSPSRALSPVRSVFDRSVRRTTSPTPISDQLRTHSASMNRAASSSRLAWDSSSAVRTGSGSPGVRGGSGEWQAVLREELEQFKREMRMQQDTQTGQSAGWVGDSGSRGGGDSTSMAECARLRREVDSLRQLLLDAVARIERLEARDGPAAGAEKQAPSRWKPHHQPQEAASSAPATSTQKSTIPAPLSQATTAPMPMPTPEPAPEPAPKLALPTVPGAGAPTAAKKDAAGPPPPASPAPKKDAAAPPPPASPAVKKAAVGPPPPGPPAPKKDAAAPPPP
eukprot:COSAG02_NODE_3030_length_7514_cov_2.660418_4_plen_379_part_01